MWTWTALALMLLSLMSHNLMFRGPRLHELILHAPTAETIDVMIAETAGGMTDETLTIILKVTTVEAGHILTEIETMVGLGTTNGCIATTCTHAIVVVASDDWILQKSLYPGIKSVIPSTAVLQLHRS